MLLVLYHSEYLSMYLSIHLSIYDHILGKKYIKRSAVRGVAEERMPYLNEFLKVWISLFM